MAPSATAQARSDRASASWSPLALLEQKVTPHDAMLGSDFGWADALDGSTALISATGDNSFRGAAYIYTNSNGTWTEGQKLTASDSQAGDQFGWGVTLAGDTLLVGASRATFNGANFQGAAYVFNKSADTWIESQKLIASDGGAFDTFGAAVALSGKTLVVGAATATIGNSLYQGAAYVFTLRNGIWAEVQKLTASDGSAGANFGCSVALTGSTMLVGAPAATVDGITLQGAVYVFTQSNGTWIQTQKITVRTRGPSDKFGQSLAVDDTTALIGAPTANANGHGLEGAAYIFTLADGTYSQSQVLTSSDGAGSDDFGMAVALAGNSALIGADQADVAQNRAQGEAYLFTRTESGWIQSKRIKASDGMAFDSFGFAVAVEPGTLLVSTPSQAINGDILVGAAYFYKRSSSDNP